MSIKIMALELGHLYFYGYPPLLAKSSEEFHSRSLYSLEKVKVDDLGFVLIKQGSTFKKK